MPRNRQKPLIATILVIAVFGCVTQRPFVPTLEESGNWRFSEGCRIYQYGVLTDPDCDILTGEGITIQITRIRLLNLEAGQDNRTTIGITFEPQRDNWYFSQPFGVLEIAGRSYASSETDEALVFRNRDGSSFPEKLEHNQQRYQLPPGERTFFRLRYPVPQSDLNKGFALRLMGLRKGDTTVAMPVIKFN